MAELRCPACSGAIELAAAAAGDKITCPHCSRTIRVRGKGGGEANAAPPPQAAKAPEPKRKKPPVSKPPANKPPVAAPAAKPPVSHVSVSDVATSAPATSARTPLARPRKHFAMPLLIGCIGLGAITVAVLAFIQFGNLGSDDQPGDNSVADASPGTPAIENPGEAERGTTSLVAPTIKQIDDVTLSTDQVLLLEVEATVPGMEKPELVYELSGMAPANARIQPDTGQLSWQPTEQHAGETVPFKVRVTRKDEPAASSDIAFAVHVTEADRPVEELVGKLQRAGSEVRELEEKLDPFMQRTCRSLDLDGGKVSVAEYSSEAEANEFADLISDHREALQQTLADEGLNLHVYRQPRVIAVYYGPADEVTRRLAGAMGEPLFEFTPEAGPSDAIARPGGEEMLAVEPVAPVEPPTDAGGGEAIPVAGDGGFTQEERDTLAALYSDRSLFNVQKYPQLRHLFSDKAQRESAVAIQTAWGEEAGRILDWLNEQPEIKETLFTAIDPATDNVAAALAIFAQLKQQFPERILTYWNLAIALAVTWDKPQAIYDYRHHQQRAKASLPDGLTGAIDQFEYFVKRENIMQGRAQWLPWEFLVHVVNHKTPIEEREWAIENYLARRAMIGRCYSDVPYDDLMLETGSARGQLNEHVYTLANLREYGGVCAHQADFASRVAQSLGVPAAYVGGESAFGDLHAWVMWIELQSVTARSIAFTLESHGRYSGDKYYVGHLTDPRTGIRITDRQLELRLHVVGMDRIAKRQADLVIAAFPELTEVLDFDVNDRFSYLERTVQLCPGNEQAWRALADMSADPLVREKHSKQMTAILNQLFDTFAAFPDFTWTIFDDLIRFETRPDKRIELYQRLVAQYLMAQRPDLACEARLRLTDLLEENDRALESVEGLGMTIMAFPDEGRYVPKMLDRIELICQKTEGAAPQLIRFYQGFLPRVPPKRGERPSRYCMDMYRRGIEIFTKYGQVRAAQMLELQLRELESGGGLQ